MSKSFLKISSKPNIYNNWYQESLNKFKSSLQIMSSALNGIQLKINICKLLRNIYTQTFIYEIFKFKIHLQMLKYLTSLKQRFYI